MSSATGGTRVFKKSSPNGKITAYLGKRDYVDHITHTDPIDGVVLIDPEYVKERKVFAKLLCAFRYGREDLDVLGLTFRKDFYTATKQVYPPENEDAKKPRTRLQERLMKKLGENSYPFFIEVPPHSPCSVTLQPAPGDTGKPCGVDYELNTYVADDAEEKLHKRYFRWVALEIAFPNIRSCFTLFAMEFVLFPWEFVELVTLSICHPWKWLEEVTITGGVPMR